MVLESARLPEGALFWNEIASNFIAGLFERLPVRELQTRADEVRGQAGTFQDAGARDKCGGSPRAMSDSRSGLKNVPVISTGCRHAASARSPRH